MPRKVPTSAAATLWPISEAAPAIDPIVMTNPQDGGHDAETGHGVAGLRQDVHRIIASSC